MTADSLKGFMDTKSASFMERQRFELKTLTLAGLLRMDDSVWTDSRPSDDVSVLVDSLIKGKLALADGSFRRSTLEELAVSLHLDENGDGSKNSRMLAAGDIRTYSHTGGQSFWHQLTGHPKFYASVCAELQRSAKERRRELSLEEIHAGNRLTRDFAETYLTDSFAIDWDKLFEVTCCASN
jgi:Type II restriction endonuclease EcoO109I